jgi:hypothetical protein
MAFLAFVFFLVCAALTSGLKEAALTSKLNGIVPKDKADPEPMVEETGDVLTDTVLGLGEDIVEMRAASDDTIAAEVDDLVGTSVGIGVDRLDGEVLGAGSEEVDPIRVAVGTDVCSLEETEAVTE